MEMNKVVLKRIPESDLKGLIQLKSQWKAGDVNSTIKLSSGKKQHTLLKVV